VAGLIFQKRYNFGMHILLIHQAFAALDEAGGTRHYEFARLLAKNGHRVTIIASPVSYLTGEASSRNKQKREEPEPGIVILRVGSTTPLHKSFIHRTLNFLGFMVASFFAGISVHKVDVVWGTSPPIFQGFTAWLLARLKRKRFLFEVRDLWPGFAIAVGVLKNKLLIRLSEWLEKFLYRHADIIMVNSPGFIPHLRQRGARRIELVPNGADASMFDPEATGEGFKRNNHLEGKFLVTYAGAHGISNDLEVVLQAAQILSKTPSIHFLFVGDGKEKTHLLRMAAALKLENVTFLPPVNKLEMREVLAASDACLAILKPIELFRTTYPNKVFDYMAAGRPVICAIDGVIREVVEQGQAGIFAQPGNPAAVATAVRQLYDDTDTRKRYGRNGRKSILKEFSRAHAGRKLLEVLDTLLRSNER
jgi:glycosyltransferase involved in cell wall biosynthesis